MFPTAKLFSDVVCPDIACKLRPCLFSHDRAPIPGVRATTSTAAAAEQQPKASTSTSKIPAKRPAEAGVARPGPVKVVKREVSTLSGTQTRSAASSSRPAGGRSDVAATSSQSSKTASSSTSSASTSGTARKLDEKIDIGAPRILTTQGAVHTPGPVRHKLLQALYDQCAGFEFCVDYVKLNFGDRFLLNYQHLPDPARAKAFASIDAKAQEESIYRGTNKSTYRNGIISAIARLKKRGKILAESETGTLEQDAERAKAREEAEKGRLTRARLDKYVANKASLERYDYMVAVPDGVGGSKPNQEGQIRKCDRCGKDFMVTADLEQIDREACNFHFGRMVTEKISGIKSRVFSCCPTPNAVPCQVGPHVFKDVDIKVLHDRFPFVATSSLTSVKDPIKVKHEVIALDCELVYTTSGMSIARLTVVDHDGSLLLDECVKPQGVVLDLNTRFSGVLPKDVEDAKLDLEGVREALGDLIDEKTIIIGHGLENDLKAMRLVHPTVIDTAIIFPHPNGAVHPNGGTWRRALRDLTRDYLGKFIQEGGAAKGHSAVEDSRAALDLVRHKMKTDNR